MKWFSNHCEAWRERISLLAAGALAEDEADEVRTHLAACAACRKYHHEITAMTAPLANWERNFSRIEPQPAMRMRWRNAVLAATNPPPSRRFSMGMLLRISWFELIRPCRYAWTAMAALWLVLWGINAAVSGPASARSGARASSASATFQVFEERRRVLAELIPPFRVPPIEPPRRNHPGPRSERLTRWSIG